MSESLPGRNFRERWVRCLKGFVSMTFKLAVEEALFPFDTKSKINLKIPERVTAVGKERYIADFH